MNCAIYIRKSRESEQAYRLELQRKKLPEYADSQGWDYQIFDEGFKSGKNVQEMTELNRLIERIRKDSIDVVLVIEFSRLSRDESLKDFVNFLDLCKTYNVKIATPGKIRDPRNSTEWFLCILEGGFSAVEMWKLRERMEEGRKAARDKGRYLGGNPPFGYKPVNKTLVPIPEKAEIVRKVFELGQTYSPREIAKNNPSFGLSPRQVRRIFDKAEKYAGLTTDSQGNIIKADWEPIISLADYEKFISGKKSRSTRPQSTQSTHLLTGMGIFRCGYCGRSIGTAAKTYKDARRKYYYCSAHKLDNNICNQSRAVDLYFLDRVFIDAFKSLFTHSDKVIEIIKSENAFATTETERLQNEQKELNRKIEKLLDAVENGAITFQDVSERIQKYKNRLQTIEKIILEKDSESLQKVENLIRQASEEIRRFENLNFNYQKTLIRKLIRKIELYKDNLIIYPRHTKNADPGFGIVIMFEKKGRPVWLNALKLNLTNEKYNELKKRLKTDKEIAKFLSVSDRTLRRWKKRNITEEYSGWKEIGWYYTTEIKKSSSIAERK